MELIQNFQNRERSPTKSILQNKDYNINNKLPGIKDNKHINFVNQGSHILNSNLNQNLNGQSQIIIQNLNQVKFNQSNYNQRNSILSSQSPLKRKESTEEDLKIVSPLRRRSIFSQKPYYMARKLDQKKQQIFLNNRENLKNQKIDLNDVSYDDGKKKKFHLLKNENQPVKNEKENFSLKQKNQSFRANISEARNEEENSEGSLGESELVDKSVEEDKSVNQSQMNETDKNEYLAKKLIKSTQNFFKPGSLEENWEQRQKNKDNLFKETEIYQNMPVIGEDGSIKKHKIVGKPEWYLKQHMIRSNQQANSLTRKGNNNFSNQFSVNLGRLNNNIDDDAKSLKSQNSMISNFQGFQGNKQQVQIQKQGSYRSIRSQTFNQQGKSPLLTNLITKKFEKNQLIMNKETLTKEMEKVLERVENNRIASRELNKRLKTQNDSLRDVLLMEKEQKNFQNFNRYQNIWQNVIASQTQKINRNYENSIIFAAESYRSKQETVKALEALKTEKEKLGDRFWEMSLRHPCVYKDKNISAIEANDVNTNENEYAKYEFDPLKSFKGSKRVEEQLEIIRKPRGNILKGKYEGASNFTTFKSDEYFRLKFANVDKEKIQKIRHLDDREYEDMEIQGKNKLESEITSLLEGAGENQMYVKKNVENEKKGEQNEEIEEIIEINYDKNKLTEMPGYSFKKFNIKY